MSVPHGSCPCQCHGQNQLDRTCNIEGGCYGFHEEPSSPMPSQTTNGNIGPCVFPGCLDVDGENARLTWNVICNACRRRYGMILHRLAWNYVAIRENMPRGQAKKDEFPIKMTPQEFGHPAQYASDMARKIADTLNEVHDDLADVRGDAPPPHPGNREAGKVQAAWHYLTCWHGELCSYPAAADTAEAVVELDREVRRLLGLTSPIVPAYAPCPGCTLLTLVRHVAVAGGDQIECQNCGYTVPEEHFGLLARISLDDVLGQVI